MKKSASPCTSMIENYFGTHFVITLKVLSVTILMLMQFRLLMRIGAKLRGCIYEI